MKSRQLKELLLLADLAEVLHYELIGVVVEIRTTMLLSEAGDADGVRRVELLFQKDAAGVDDVRHLRFCLSVNVDRITKRCSSTLMHCLGQS